MIKIKALMVNHNEETFAELTHAQALEIIFGAEQIDTFGDFSNVILNLGYNQVELYKIPGLLVLKNMLTVLMNFQKSIKMLQMK